jgi:hypothetical protein
MKPIRDFTVSKFRSQMLRIYSMLNFCSRKYSLLLLFVFALEISGCCSLKNCNLAQTSVIPYIDGVYQLPSLPIDHYYVLVDGHEFPVNQHFPGDAPVNCDSDMSNISLNCCDKLYFYLFVSFQGGATGPMRLDSTQVMIKSRNGCFIVDVDPHHNKN